MRERLLSTRDIGSGPRDPAILGLMRPAPLTREQISRAIDFLENVESLPARAYGARVERAVPSLAEEYAEMASRSYPERLRGGADLVVKIGVTTLHNLGFARAWNLEWTRSEMVEWERADVGGFKKSENWQHSYGTRFWKPSEIIGEITYTGSSARHAEEVARVQRFAVDRIRVPVTDPHCVVHANDNLFYYGLQLGLGESELLAGIKGDHAAGVDFARRVSRDRVRSIAAQARDGEVIDVQWDNFIVAAEKKEYERDIIKRMGLTVPSYVELLKEVTEPRSNVEYSSHNCLQPYHLYVPYLPLELPRISRFHYEISTHDTEKLGLTSEQRTGQGWDAVRLLKEHGLGRQQKIVVDAASTYEGATPPAPELVRDRILYPILVLGYAPEQVEVAPACGQRNLSLPMMLRIGVNIHLGRDLALRRLERDYGVDAEPHLTSSYLGQR